MAASMLTAIDHSLGNGTPFQDLGADHFDRRSTESKVNHHLAQLAKPDHPLASQPLTQAA